ncbi:membrane-associated protein [Lacibacter cauensis]|uniref:Membrane-associated protein n=1 Tax=Lacibacter cauensis TaxID=510947 RepID=A0A562SU60_9BACT|nr:VTT domain-containing protein [Lacibacter cauensis]TWI84865.1 membrane-associated protein [Lacibacter cauensis]
MKKRSIQIVLMVVMLLGISQLHAQKQVNVRVFNQYEAPADKFTVDGVEYATTKDGTITININATDSVTFAGNEYDAKKYAVADLKEGITVELHKQFTWKDLLNPMFYIKYGGLWLLLFIIFAETGLLFGFFLPGDSLLFVAGIYSGNLAREFLKIVGLGGVQNEWFELLVLCTLISLAGILGNWIGYWTGRKIGPAMYNWNDNLLFKKRYLHEAHDFYEKHGGGAIVFARFLPFIRTFAPIIAGIVDMDRKKFVFFNVVGCVAWVVSMIFAGHFLQIWVKKQFGIELKDKLELIVIIIIAVTTAPVFWKLIFGKKAEKPNV